MASPPDGCGPSPRANGGPRRPAPGAPRTLTPEASSRPKIPGKLYFRIGEVTEITGVQPYTLRHWESEFPTLNPKKNDAGQRLYRRAEIEMVLEIQRLLHLEGYTTAGARRLLSQRAKTKGRGGAASPKPAAPARPAAAPDRKSVV